MIIATVVTFLAVRKAMELAKTPPPVLPEHAEAPVMRWLNRNEMSTDRHNRHYPWCFCNRTRHFVSVLLPQFVKSANEIWLSFCNLDELAENLVCKHNAWHCEDVQLIWQSPRYHPNNPKYCRMRNLSTSTFYWFHQPFLFPSLHLQADRQKMNP